MLLFVSSSGHGKRTPLDAFNRQGRGGQGVRGMRVTEARGVVVAAFTVSPGDEILVFSSAGNIVRMGVDEISEQGRDATGVRVARLDEGDTVVAVAPGARGRATARRPRGRRRRSPEPWRVPKAVLETRSFGNRRSGAPTKRERCGATSRRARSVYERRYRQTVRSVDLWSVLKIVDLLLPVRADRVARRRRDAVVDRVGGRAWSHNIENFVGELVSDNDFHFLSWEVLRGATLVGLVIVCLLVVITVLAAAFYNLFSELLGGIEVTVVEHEDVR